MVSRTDSSPYLCGGQNKIKKCPHEVEDLYEFYTDIFHST